MLSIQPHGGSAPVQFSHTGLVNYLTSNKAVRAKPQLRSALLQIDRGLFIPEELKHLAYQDRLLKAAFDEVITNPSTVVTLLNELDPQPGGVYLHLGGGLGYMSELLAFLAGSSGQVYSLERIQWFWDRARKAHKFYQNLTNLEILYRDGSKGFPDKDRAPFDGILASFRFNEPPHHLLDQLKVGGKLIFPTENHTAIVWQKMDDENDFIEWQVPNVNSYAFGEMHEGLA